MNRALDHSPTIQHRQRRFQTAIMFLFVMQTFPQPLEPKRVYLLKIVPQEIEHPFIKLWSRIAPLQKFHLRGKISLVVHQQTF